MDLIDEVWKRVETCLNPDMSELDKVRTKMNFYCGAMAVTRALAEISEQTGEDVSGDFCQAVANEGADFIGELLLSVAAPMSLN